LKDMQTKLETIRSRFSESLSTVEGSDALQSLKIRYLGKKGELTQLLRSLGNLPAEERPLAGQALNELRADFELSIGQKEIFLARAEDEAAETSDAVDLTLPPRGRTWGAFHPVEQTMNEIIDIFMGMGFSVAYGPEIEDDFHNFEAPPCEGYAGHVLPDQRKASQNPYKPGRSEVHAQMGGPLEDHHSG